MDPNFPNQPPINLARAFRQVLVARGFSFCDEGEEPEQPQFPPPDEAAAEGCEALLLEGVEASSTDAHGQGIGCTLDDQGHSFWSSTGSQGPDASEFLLYKLRSPLCLLRHVQLVVFRAHYQWGGPIYPPSFVSFQTGPSPWSLAPPAIKYPVAATDAVQTFPLPADLPLGRYLRINLHGKRQRQLEDMQYYHAIQRVEAFGRQLSAAEASRLRGWLAARPRPLPAPGVVPTYAAADMVESRQQQQQQQPAEQRQESRHGEQRQADAAGPVEDGEEEEEQQQQQHEGHQQQRHEEQQEAAALEGGARRWWWWPGERLPAAAAAGAAGEGGLAAPLRAESLESGSESSLSFTG